MSSGTGDTDLFETWSVSAFLHVFQPGNSTVQSTSCFRAEGKKQFSLCVARPESAHMICLI